MGLGSGSGGCCVVFCDESDGDRDKPVCDVDKESRRERKKKKKERKQRK